MEKKENNEYPLLEISEKGKYVLSIDKGFRVIPESKEGFDNIVKGKKLTVVFTPDYEIAERLHHVKRLQ